MRRTYALVNAIAAIAAITAGATFATMASASGTGTISGVTFQDANRNGVQDAGEAPFANHRLYLLDGSTGTYLKNVVTDSAGRYTFNALAEGQYRVEYEGNTWSSFRQDWVPTTTGSIYPRQTVAVGASVPAVANFGWRPIVRSTTLGSPISSVVGPSGIKVESYDDAVSAQELHDRLVSGQLVGAEAGSVTIRFDYGSASATATSVQTVNGRYEQYSAVVTVTYDSFLTTYDRTLFHEYGHAWSMYYGYLAQQDSSFASYLRARGLEGDARVGTTYAWDTGEMIAEDYRQLFGTPTAAQYDQVNREIPPASEVPGLRDFLQTSFRQAATTGTATTSNAPVASQPALSISGLAVNPTTVSKSGTVSFQLSSASRVTVEIRNAAGSVVRTLLSSVSKQAGTVTATWDRKDSAGRRVKPGSYSAVASATDTTGTTSASSAFTVA